MTAYVVAFVLLVLGQIVFYEVYFRKKNICAGIIGAMRRQVEWYDHIHEGKGRSHFANYAILTAMVVFETFVPAALVVGLAYQIIKIFN